MMVLFHGVTQLLTIAVSRGIQVGHLPQLDCPLFLWCRPADAGFTATTSNSNLSTSALNTFTISGMQLKFFCKWEYSYSFLSHSQKTLNNSLTPPRSVGILPHRMVQLCSFLHRSVLHIWLQISWYNCRVHHWLSTYRVPLCQMHLLTLLWLNMMLVIDKLLLAHNSSH